MEHKITRSHWKLFTWHQSTQQTDILPQYRGGSLDYLLRPPSNFSSCVFNIYEFVMLVLVKNEGLYSERSFYKYEMRWRINSKMDKLSSRQQLEAGRESRSQFRYACAIKLVCLVSLCCWLKKEKMFLQILWINPVLWLSDMKQCSCPSREAAGWAPRAWCLLHGHYQSCHCFNRAEECYKLLSAVTFWHYLTL